ncbi:MAG: TlpA disulfide reductase family protein [Planctomycetia bacterium]|nr:TlpA disulfide reductase family protein [Planctomycetia bacterium]
MKSYLLYQIAATTAFTLLMAVTMPTLAPTLLAEESAGQKAGLDIPRSQEDDLAILEARKKLVQEAQSVDLTQKPWLVETARLSVNHPALLRDRTIWADSWLYHTIDEIAPAVEVEKWLTPLPDLNGKFVLIEMWATWCPPCRRSLPYLNFIAEKYQDDLVVVSICETDENAIANMPGALDLKDVHYAMAVDTGRRFANRLKVWGIPHAILLEPVYGGVVWEGMPTLPLYSLDDVTLEAFFEQAKICKEKGMFPEKSPVVFSVSEPTEAQRASRLHQDNRDAPDVVGDPTRPVETQPE